MDPGFDLGLVVKVRYVSVGCAATVMVLRGEMTCIATESLY